MTVPTPPDRPETEAAPGPAPESAFAAAPAPEAASEAEPVAVPEAKPEAASDPGAKPEAISASEGTPEPTAVPEAKPEPIPAPEGTPEPTAAPWAKSADTPPPANPWAAPDPNAAPQAPFPTQAPFPAPGPFPAPAPGPVPVPGAEGMYWPPYAVPAAPPRNGMGITALVLGIVGLVLCLPLILFWLSWLPALLAVIFGSIGLSLARKGLATNRAMALTGTVLGLVGLVASVCIGVLAVAAVRSDVRVNNRTVKQQQRDNAERQRLAEDRAKQHAAEQEAKAADERARRLSFGGSYTYPDGLKVTMAEPTPATPSRSGGAQLPQDATFVQVRVTVVNTTSAELSLYGSGLLIVKDSRGTLLHPMFGGGQYTALPQTLGPGQEATALETYGLPNASANPFSLQFTHGTRMERKDVIWTGAPPH
ncbi:hypothetical protein [Kitasatospora sp. NPDC059673]|uniref:hypothetical protein n=1 Tax=Kitasatospora sp. NPDC059673 TaxID=3346901 RepID=UPI0036997D20